MSRRAFATILALVLTGCTAGGAPSPSRGQAETAQATSVALATPSPAPSPICEPADGGSFHAVVLATSNVFGAGREYAPAPGGGGGGSIPPACNLPAGVTTVTFPSATGQVTPYIGQPLMNEAAGDRQGAGGDNTDIRSYRGVSGIVNGGNGMFLTGVFLTDAEPADPAPERLDFTDGEDFAELAPEIGQTFLIGDGKGRRYSIPSRATRLFLGFADGFLYGGDPGWYANNAGELEVTVAVE